MLKRVVVSVCIVCSSSYGAYAVSLGNAGQQETIHDVIAGQKMRQAEHEKAFTSQLHEARFLSPETARESARQAYEASKNTKMEGLERTYTDNIWAQVQGKMEAYGHEFDMDYVKELVSKNQEAEIYDFTHLYVFISESVPELTLRNYLDALEKVNVAYVLRGTIGNDIVRFLPTQQWVQKLLCGTEQLSSETMCKAGPIDINPNLYGLFGITQVPALVYLKEPAQIAMCGGGSIDEEDFLLWYGDMAPDYVLKMFLRQNPQDTTLMSLISAIQPTVWANEERVLQ